jgi:hypothetical protein
MSNIDLRRQICLEPMAPLSHGLVCISIPELTLSIKKQVNHQTRSISNQTTIEVDNYQARGFSNPTPICWILPLHQKAIAIG